MSIHGGGAALLFSLLQGKEGKKSDGENAGVSRELYLYRVAAGLGTLAFPLPFSSFFFSSFFLPYLSPRSHHSSLLTTDTLATDPPRATPRNMSSPGAKVATGAKVDTGIVQDAESLRHRGAPSTAPAHADEHLEALGYKPELARSRSTLQVAFMSFVLASIPYGLATTMTYPLIGGGPVDIIWGWVGVSLVILCVAASLGEITSVYPTAGGELLSPLLSRVKMPGAQAEQN
ncbi:hypothetical protein IMZ48_28280 [Candidatus Bathyarchaeota archaeon]|nr:hypothetical protein [Candidatus Bathyarchaeota archaeon]